MVLRLASKSTRIAFPAPGAPLSSTPPRSAGSRGAVGNKIAGLEPRRRVACKTLGAELDLRICAVACAVACAIGMLGAELDLRGSATRGAVENKICCL